MDKGVGDCSGMNFEWLVERLAASLVVLRLSGVDPRQGPRDDLQLNIAAIRAAARREGIRDDPALRAADELGRELATPTTTTPATAA